MRVTFRGVFAALLFTSTAHAFVPRSSPRVAADTLTALPAAGITKPLRGQQALDYHARPSPALAKFQAYAGGRWQVAWDAATGAPTRIWGSGIAAPGANASAAIAEGFARQVLADHIALLAPGATPTDFELVSNTSDGDIRAVGFVQRAGGLRVVGGQISFEFKRDRLFVIGSEALPNVRVVQVRARLDAVDLQAKAAVAARDAVGLPAAPVSAVGAEVILPFVGDDAILGYRLVAPLEVDGQADGRYRAYVDVATGAVVAAVQLNTYATGSVLYHGVNRYPGRGYVDRPAPQVHVKVNGAPQTTTAAGAITWSPDGDAQVQTTTDGDLVTIVNKASDTRTSTVANVPVGVFEVGPLVTGMFTVAAGGQLVWDTSAQPEEDAQLDAYLDTNLAKQYVRDHVDPDLPTLSDQMTVNVNIANTCNAFFDGKSLNFFAASPSTCHPSPLTNNCCENTARIQDVNFHEYGHRVHTAEIIMGVGDFDGGMSEGAADFLAVSITGDSGMGRGFFFTDVPLRELDPPDVEWRWPEDIGEIHHTGLIFGGTFWDLRKTLLAELGPTAGEALTNKLYVGALRRAINIPTSLIEALATDDDDGDLSNGTPHECEIRDAFGRHGMRTASGSVEAPGAIATNAAVVGVIVDVGGLSGRCASDQVVGAKLSWRPPFTGVPHSGSVDAIPAGPNRYYAQLPLSPHESVFYRAAIEFADGSQFYLPDNLVDPYYQLYQGATIPLYCTSFEDGDPLAAGWTTGTDDSSPSPWSWTVPDGMGPTDPPVAFSGTHVLSLAPNANYPPSQHSWAQMPEIDIGQYSDVRLQFRRWLAVEDSHYDQARVLVDGQRVWMNATQNMADASSYAHIDKEWRFVDVAISAYVQRHKLRVAWDLKSDAGLEYGGWALDDVCVVANPESICGDGVKQAYEGCDSGSANADVPDACRTNCHLPACGDSIVDSNEQCDDGAQGSTTCTAGCKVIAPKDGGGCCGAGGGASSLALAAGLTAALGRRRRRGQVRGATPMIP
jgi:hypothetical protein